MRPSVTTIGRASSVLFLALALTKASSAQTAQTGSTILYAGDSRQELIQCDNAAVKMAAQATVSLISEASLLREDGHVSFEVGSLGEDLELCTSPRFADQPVLADCSGVLVAEDLVLTAGHCIDSQTQCEATSFAFGFSLNALGQTKLEDENIYECEELVGREVTHQGYPVLHDYALVRLSRTASPEHQPAPIRLRPAERGEQVYLVGNGLGLPTKVDPQGQVVRGRPGPHDYFLAHIDNFHRGSGSPVFDANGLLLGIAVRGGVDFDGDATCLRIRDLEAGTPLAEEVSYARTSLALASPELFDWTEEDLVAEADTGGHAHHVTPAPLARAACSAHQESGPSTPWLANLLLAISIYLQRQRRQTSQLTSNTTEQQQ